MDKKKVLIVFGTRPEAIKMIPVVKAFQEDATMDVVVCNTAQHRQMTDQVMQYFSIQAQHDLDIMKDRQTLNGLFSRLMAGLDTVMTVEKPDIVLVHGDTSTCLAACLAAFHLQIPVGHVEAGLRTYDFTQPFPEEMNRQLCDQIASLHFAPTQRAVDQLKKQLGDQKSIVHVGNTIVDAVQLALPMIDEDNKAIVRLKSWLDLEKKCIVVTGHRRENFGTAILDIIRALKELAHAQNVQIIYPVHLNPQVQEPVNAHLGDLDNVLLCDPLDYESFLWLLHKSDFIITDSGGIQEEATVLQKRVLVTRNTTERQEAVDSGHITLVGSDFDTIISESKKLLHNNVDIDNLSQPYGFGNSSQKIVQSCKFFLGE